MTRIASTLGVLTLLAFALPARAPAQATLHADHPTNPANPTPPDDPAAQASDQLLQAVSQSVIGLEATGDRTSEAIADSAVTLSLAAMPNPVQFKDICTSGGDRLRTFTQSLAGQLDLSGQALTPVCTGSGQDADPFKLRFHLHFEGGQAGLFTESPILIPISLLAPSEQELGPADQDPEPPNREPDPNGQAPTDQAPDPPQPAPINQLPPAPKTGQPILLDPRHTQTSHAEMTLPPGWSTSDLPKPVHTDSAFATLDRTVTIADGKLVTDQRLLIKKDKVDPVDVPAFDKWSESAEIDQTAPPIQLDSNLYYPSSAFTGKTDDEKKAADLIHEAYEDVESKNFKKAETALAQAEQLDPGHEILHENKGMLAEARGDLQAALLEYQQELRNFPDVPIEMESIARAQRLLGRTDDAIATLQRWMAADPNSTFPVMQLMLLYHSIDRDDLAAATGDQAMIAMNGDARRSVRFLVIYGHEQIFAGQPDAAKLTLETLLNYTTDIQLVNDAAYYLSEQGLSLDRAEETVRASLTQFDPENDGQMPHMFTMDQKQQTNLMLASWDTLGWILYRKNELPEAEAYIRAAWRGRQDPAIGRHLGEILVAEDKPVEALDAYKLALAAIPAHNADKADKDPDVIAIRAEVKRLEKEGHASTLTDPAAALARLRILDAGAAGKMRGETRFQVFISLANGIVASPLDQSPSRDAVAIISAIKLPPDFFPPASHVVMIKDATLNCTTVCSLTLLP